MHTDVMLLDINSNNKERSGENFKTSDLKLIRTFLENSEAIYKFDMERKPKKRELRFGTIPMILCIMWMELKKTTIDGLLSELKDDRGQYLLRCMGMPMHDDGRCICPSKGWISDFRNHVWPLLSQSLKKEVAEHILSVNEYKFFTCDSTPLEASRYSSAFRYNPHYEIRMGKAHIIMVNGFPLYYTLTNGNEHDITEFDKLLDMMGPNDRKGIIGMATDGAYASFEMYAKVFDRTGVVMASNAGSDAVFHPEAEWEDVIRHYNKYWKNDDFVNAKHTKKDRILRYLIKNGEAEFVGKFLRNMDLRRGKLKDKWAKARHVCEEVHRAMKRWVCFDVRGLCTRTYANAIDIRFFICQLLSLTFEPYDFEIC